MGQLLPLLGLVIIAGLIVYYYEWILAMLTGTLIVMIPISIISYVMQSIDLLIYSILFAPFVVIILIMFNKELTKKIILETQLEESRSKHTSDQSGHWIKSGNTWKQTSLKEIQKYKAEETYLKHKLRKLES